MTMTGLLSQDELRELTGYARAPEQRRILDEQGIPYKSIGSRTIVLHQHVAAWVEGRPVRRFSEPNLALVK